MKREAQSNYEQVYEHFRTLFLQSDQERTVEKLGLSWDGSRICIPYFHREYLLDKTTGEITGKKGEPVHVADRLLMMHHLHYYQETASLSGEWVPFRQIKEAAHFERAYQSMALRPLERAYGGKARLLQKRMEEIGGKKAGYGDASAVFQVFPKIPVIYIFWDGDEEFPPSANILFDKNITQWIHPESIPGIAEAGTNHILADTWEFQ